MNKLQRILGIGAIALGLIGCRDSFPYEYDGVIGNNQVAFIGKKFSPLDDTNRLIAVKSDGRMIVYEDKFGNDLKLDLAEVTKDGQTTEYLFYKTPYNKIDKPVLEELQRQFDNYLKQIKEIKMNRSW